MKTRNHQNNCSNNADSFAAGQLPLPLLLLLTEEYSTSFVVVDKRQVDTILRAISPQFYLR